MKNVLAFERKSKNGMPKKTGKFEIKNATDESADLYMYGYISDDKWYDDDVVPSDIKDFLDQIKDVKNLNIYINSGGGSVWAGMAIYSMLKRFSGYKAVFVDGLAASMASVIAFCGDELTIPANAYFMIHKPSTFAFGNADDLLEVAALLDKVEDGLMNVYEEHLAKGVSIDAIKELVEAETWFTGKDAAQYFDIKVGAENKAVAYADVSDFEKAPKGISDAEKDQKKIEQAKLNLALQMSKTKFNKEK